MNQLHFRAISLSAPILMLVAAILTGCRQKGPAAGRSEKEVRQFSVTGLVKEVNIANRRLTVAHEEVPNFMPAMTMPFDVRDTNALLQLRSEDSVTFRLTVTDKDSWIDHITILTNIKSIQPDVSKGTPVQDQSSLITFTNEFGRPVKMTDFAGQAIALTFFFTRCPIPNACPRLSQNFAEASRSLLAKPNLPTNWRFLSISIDSEFDTPEVLKAYAKRYNYNSNHWSFLTAPADRVGNLTRMFGFDFKPDVGFFTHGFRTVILTPSNRVQQIYPIGGELSSAIVQDILKALGSTNQP